MARDQWDDGNRSDLWFGENMTPFLEPSLSRYEKDIANAVENFGVRVADAFTQFENRMMHDLNQGTIYLGEHGPTPEELKGLLRPVIESRFVQSGASMTAGTIVVAAGIGMIGTGALIRELSQTLRQAIARILSPVVAKAVTRMTVAGPAAAIPLLGWCVTLGGTAWTGVDIYRIRGNAQKAFLRGLDNSIADLGQQLDRQVRRPMEDVLNHLQNSQEEFTLQITQAIG